MEQQQQSSAAAAPPPVPEGLAAATAMAAPPDLSAPPSGAESPLLTPNGTGPRPAAHLTDDIVEDGFILMDREYNLDPDHTLGLPRSSVATHDPRLPDDSLSPGSGFDDEPEAPYSESMLSLHTSPRGWGLSPARSRSGSSALRSGSSRAPSGDSPALSEISSRLSSQLSLQSAGERAGSPGFLSISPSSDVLGSAGPPGGLSSSSFPSPPAEESFPRDLFRTNPEPNDMLSTSTVLGSSPPRPTNPFVTQTPGPGSSGASTSAGIGTGTGTGTGRLAEPDASTLHLTNAHPYAGQQHHAYHSHHQSPHHLLHDNHLPPAACSSTGGERPAAVGPQCRLPERKHQHTQLAEAIFYRHLMRSPTSFDGPYLLPGEYLIVQLHSVIFQNLNQQITQVGKLYVSSVHLFFADAESDTRQQLIHSALDPMHFPNRRTFEATRAILINRSMRRIPHALIRFVSDQGEIRLVDSRRFFIMSHGNDWILQYLRKMAFNQAGTRPALAQMPATGVGAAAGGSLGGGPGSSSSLGGGGGSGGSGTPAGTGPGGVWARGAGSPHMMADVPGSGPGAGAPLGGEGSGGCASGGMSLGSPQFAQDPAPGSEYCFVELPGALPALATGTLPGGRDVLAHRSSLHFEQDAFNFDLRFAYLYCRMGILRYWEQVASPGPFLGSGGIGGPGSGGPGAAAACSVPAPHPGQNNHLLGVDLAGPAGGSAATAAAPPGADPDRPGLVTYMSVTTTREALLVASFSSCWSPDVAEASDYRCTACMHRPCSGCMRDLLEEHPDLGDRHPAVLDQIYDFQDPPLELLESVDAPSSDPWRGAPGDYGWRLYNPQRELNRLLSRVPPHANNRFALHSIEYAALEPAAPTATEAGANGAPDTTTTTTPGMLAGPGGISASIGGSSSSGGASSSLSSPSFASSAGSSASSSSSAGGPIVLAAPGSAPADCLDPKVSASDSQLLAAAETSFQQPHSADCRVSLCDTYPPRVVLPSFVPTGPHFTPTAAAGRGSRLTGDQAVTFGGFVFSPAALAAGASTAAGSGAGSAASGSSAPGTPGGPPSNAPSPAFHSPGNPSGLPELASVATMARSAAQFRSRGRLPVVTWVSPAGVALARASQPMSGMFASRSVGDEALCSALVDAAAVAQADRRAAWPQEFGPVRLVVGPAPGRVLDFDNSDFAPSSHSSAANILRGALASLTSSAGSATGAGSAAGRGSASTQAAKRVVYSPHGRLPQASVEPPFGEAGVRAIPGDSTAAAAATAATAMAAATVAETAVVPATPIPGLFILDARPMLTMYFHRAKGFGAESPQYYGADVVFGGIGNVQVVAGAYRQMRLAALQKAPTFEQVLSAAEPWLALMARILASAHQVQRRILRGRSTLVHCSDGWDRTPQVSSLATLSMDGFHRTLEGFAVLVEREWAWHGHQFELRNGHANEGAYTDAECAPIFLQWLDAVFQLVRCYPDRFEFTERALLAIEREIYACRTGTFRQDNLRQRFCLSPFSASVSGSEADGKSNADQAAGGCGVGGFAAGSGGSGAGDSTAHSQKADPMARLDPAHGACCSRARELSRQSSQLMADSETGMPGRSLSVWTLLVDAVRAGYGGPHAFLNPRFRSDRELVPEAEPLDLGVLAHPRALGIWQAVHLRHSPLRKEPSTGELDGMLKRARNVPRLLMDSMHLDERDDLYEYLVSQFFLPPPS
ncbi:hypothetical protein H696_00621 [Fonticula alba]|uniref:Myotubularin phosphatase domain-containing protein n=1 Tax=Fonticula alba TaxID=691883 RepID=A0A058ZFB4_FONAL|nr:hypothetical protein H696_00621 [Fonticula alba]KCV73075.1 hypothetical protein H696_00621 [Fonticula alba]|eukprot:XP_009492776.1 hypothetical protein H696_00621 [Fonticula alba]